VEEKKTGLSLS